MSPRKPGVFDPWRQQQPELPPPPDVDTLVSGTDPDKYVEELCFRVPGRHGGLYIYGPASEMPDLGLAKLVEALRTIPAPLRERYGVCVESGYPEQHSVTIRDDTATFYVRVLNHDRSAEDAGDALALLFQAAQRGDPKIRALFEGLQITPYIR